MTNMTKRMMMQWLPVLFFSGTVLAAEDLDVRISRQYDAERRDFTVDGRSAFVILPSKPAADGTKPWLWYAPTFKNLPDTSHAWMFKQLLNHGFAIAGIEVGESYGNPEGRAAFTKLYEHLIQEYGVARKVCLLPQSRGGLMLYNWAAENSDKVQCIGGIYTVCDMASYPGLGRACGAYKMTEAQLREKLTENNPIDRLEPLAKAKVPILHVHGDNDKVVPLERNSGELMKRYQALGGPSRLIVIPGKGHQVCPEFFNCQPLVDFFLHYGQNIVGDVAGTTNVAADNLAKEFVSPPAESRTWCYWWWLKGWIDEEGIRADLDHMKNVGISGALVFHAGPKANKTPFTTEFMSPRWQELFRHAVEQAALRDIEIGLNLCDGWNAGGPWITEQYAMSTRHMTKASGGPPGFELDAFNPAAMDLHWDNIIGKIIDEAGPKWRDQYVGKTFKYTHIDSWEGGNPLSSPVLAAEFKARRGYELGSTNGVRYTEDVDLTRMELWAENYYGRLTEKSHALKMQTHSEAGGPSVPLYHYMADLLRNFGSQDIVMGEFWAREDGTNIKFHNEAKSSNLQKEDLIKSASSAAHIYGKKIVQAEAFTKIQKNFTLSFWDLKDVGDRAFCQGLNRNVLCFMVAQAGSGVKPGYTWRDVGMEFPRTMTYWPMGKVWIDYLNRCQHLLRKGEFVADFLYFHGNRGPVTMPAKFHMKPGKPGGYDCDMVNAHALLTRATAKDKRVVFPDGQSYRYLVLREDNTDALTPAVLTKLLELVSAGVTLVGSAPERNFGNEGLPASDEAFKKVREEIWGRNPGGSGKRTVGSGCVIWGMSLQDLVNQDKLAPDVEIVEDAATAALPASVMSGLINPGFDYVHRKIGRMDVYFVVNLRNATAAGDFTFRSHGQPQIWNAVDGSIQNMPVHTVVGDNRVKVSLTFKARQSLFVVFGSREKAEGSYHNNQMVFDHEISGPWNVAFDKEWGGPAGRVISNRSSEGMVVFEKLQDWKDHENNGIKYYSGTASYTRTFDLPEGLRGGKQSIYLNLGDVKDMAEVTLNGIKLGVLWCEPFQLDISSVVKNSGNILKINVVNKWSNRLLGDEVLKEKYTTGNASHAPTLFSSGLLGPVKLGRRADAK